jgi:hypothetical protein
LRGCQLDLEPKSKGWGLFTPSPTKCSKSQKTLDAARGTGRRERDDGEQHAERGARAAGGRRASMHVGLERGAARESERKRLALLAACAQAAAPRLRRGRAFSSPPPAAGRARTTPTCRAAPTNGAAAQRTSTASPPPLIYARRGLKAHSPPRLPLLSTLSSVGMLRGTEGAIVLHCSNLRTEQCLTSSITQCRHERVLGLVRRRWSRVCAEEPLSVLSR